MLTIKIKYLEPNMYPLKAIPEGDWIDLRAAKDVHLEKGQYYMIPLGVAMQLPEGYEAHIVPRSSTYMKFGVIQTNHMGVVDNSYSGDGDQWMFAAYALRDTVINMNDRICQFRIVEKQPDFEIEEVEHLDDTDRGGFGSTGK